MATLSRVRTKKSLKQRPRPRILECYLGGTLITGIDLQNLFIDLSGTHHASLADAKAAGAATINYGLFLNTIVDFIFVAFAVFLLVRRINRMRAAAPAEVLPNTRACPYCLSSIPALATKCAQCTSPLPAAGLA